MEQRVFNPAAKAEKYTFKPEMLTHEEIHTLKVRTEREWETFFNKPEDEITAASVIPALEAGEEFTRKALLKKRGEREPKVDVWYDRWEKYKKALDGAKGAGPVSETASFLHSLAASHREKQNGPQPDRQPITSKREVVAEFERLAGRAQEKSQLESRARRLELAARLFESAPKWEVAQKS